MSDPIAVMVVFALGLLAGLMVNKQRRYDAPIDPLVLCLVLGMHRYEGGVCTRCGYSDPSQNRGDQA